MGSLTDHKNAALPGVGSLADRELAFWTGGSVPFVPNVVFDGDSQSAIGLPAGNVMSTTEYGDTFPSLAISGIDPRASVASVAVSGHTILNRSTAAAAAVDTLYVPGARNVVVFWCGTNDLGTGITAAVTYARLVAYCAARRAVGWKVVVFSVLPRTDAGSAAGYEAERTTLNTNIRTNWATFADAFCDIALDTRLQDSTSGRYFDGSLVHLSMAGRFVVAGFARKALSGIGVPVTSRPQLEGLTSPAASKGMAAVGEWALSSVTTGIDNTAVGRFALLAVTSGGSNVGVGRDAGKAITTGLQNVAVGTSSMNGTTTGYNNVAIGQLALYSNITGLTNTAVGALAGFGVTVSEHVAIGYQAGYGPAGLTANKSTTGLRQTNIGTETGQNSVTQRNDTTAVGYRALVDGNNATALGSGALAGAAGAVAIGKDSAGTSATTVVADEIKLGTALHTTNILGALKLAPTAFVAADRYLVMSAAGIVHLSAVGPAS